MRATETIVEGFGGLRIGDAGSGCVEGWGGNGCSPIKDDVSDSGTQI